MLSDSWYRSVSLGVVTSFGRSDRGAKAFSPQRALSGTSWGDSDALTAIL